MSPEAFLEVCPLLILQLDQHICHTDHPCQLQEDEIEAHCKKYHSQEQEDHDHDSEFQGHYNHDSDHDSGEHFHVDDYDGNDSSSGSHELQKKGYQRGYGKWNILPRTMNSLSITVLV